MARYRKKPVVVEAEQFNPGLMNPHDWPEGVYATNKSPTGYAIGTLESTVAGCGHEVTPGDWIITGVANEKYPCKPRIFAETYERIE